MKSQMSAAPVTARQLSLCWSVSRSYASDSTTWSDWSGFWGAKSASETVSRTSLPRL